MVVGVRGLHGPIPEWGIAHSRSSGLRRQTGPTLRMHAHDRKHYLGDHAFNTQPGHIPLRARVIARDDQAHESLWTSTATYFQGCRKRRLWQLRDY